MMSEPSVQDPLDPRLWEPNVPEVFGRCPCCRRKKLIVVERRKNDTGFEDTIICERCANLRKETDRRSLYEEILNSLNGAINAELCKSEFGQPEARN